MFCRSDSIPGIWLKQAAEKAKIELSTAPFVTIEEDHIGRRGFKDAHLSYELSRSDFVQMIEDELSRTMDSVTKALEDAGLKPSDIDKVILVGGSTRIPAISSMLEEKIGKTPHSEIDPDLCVALGAAIQGGREMGMDQTSILLDITPYTFGTVALGFEDGIPTPDIYVPLIRRNTKLPASRSEVFYTLMDKQEAVDVQVFQGEKKYASENVRIGNFKFELSQLPGGSEIVMKMDLDLNGILKVHAVEKKTGKYIEGVVEDALVKRSEEELADSKSRVNALWDSTFDPPENVADLEIEKSDLEEAPGEYQWLFKQAEEKLNSAPAEDRDEIVNLLQDLKEALGANDMEKAGKIADELEDILFYLE